MKFIGVQRLQFPNIEKTMKNSPIVFKDIRNMRRNQTIALGHGPIKEVINSTKDLKKARSSQQIDLTSYLENKNEKIKDIDVKMQIHQTEIQKNNQIIEQLNQNFVNLKEQIEKQKEATQAQQRKNRLLREEVERTTKILRAKNSRIQECSKKIADLQKENEALKTATVKLDEYSKTANSLRIKTAALEETNADLKQALAEKDRQIIKQKEKNANLEALRSKEEDLNSKILGKDQLIGTLKQTIQDLNSQKYRDTQEKNLLQGKIFRLEAQIASTKEASCALSNTIEALQKKAEAYRYRLTNIQGSSKQYQVKLKSKEHQQEVLRRECNEIKAKYSQLSLIKDEQAKEILKKESKIDKLNQKINELQNNLSEGSQDREKTRNLQDKIGSLKKKVDALQNMYYGIIPQIQCPFGHELKNPVTIIPCGHNYCLGCKKGYSKECMQCSGKFKIEAIYRNQLMDDIIGIVGGIRQIMEVLK